MGKQFPHCEANHTFPNHSSMRTESLSRVRSKLLLWLLPTLNRRIKIGNKNGLRGRLKIHGPGSVKIGNNVMFDNSTGRANRIQTFNSEASVTIGNNCYLNGVEIACMTAIQIGDACIVA